MKKPKSKKKVEALTEYVGIIDTRGLDFFAEVTKDSLFHAQIRSQSNPHRHACMFLCSLPAEMKIQEVFKSLKDTWEMWNFIQAFCKELKCRPEDAKTIANIRELSKTKRKLTGKVD